MDYIIDPRLFYLAGICENLGLTLSILGALGLAGFATIGIVSSIEVICYNENDFKPLMKKSSIGLIVSLCMLIIAQFIPDKETCYAMMVAKTATVENVEFTIETLKSLVDYIAEVCAK